MPSITALTCYHDDCVLQVWTEYKEGRSSTVDEDKSSVNFLPGMGAFLQSIIYGFAGIRIRPQMLEFHNPQPPPDSSELRLMGIKYLGTRMDIIIKQQGQVVITVHEENSALPLVLRFNDTYSIERTLRTGQCAHLSNRGQVSTDTYVIEDRSVHMPV